MLAFDIPFAFVAAGALSWRYPEGRADVPLLFVGAGVAAPGLAFLDKYPDWDLQYFVDPSALPIGATGMFAGAVILMGWLGAKAGRSRPRVVAIMAALLVLFTVVTLPRTGHVGTRAEYLAGTAPALGLDFLTFATPWFLWSGLVMGGCIFLLERGRRSGAA